MKPTKVNWTYWVFKYILTAPFRWLRSKIVRYLLRLRTKLQLGSLRAAIHDADKDKDRTGRKNIVVLNSSSGVYEPFQKKLLKAGARAGKNRSNKALTPGRKKMMVERKARIIDFNRVKTIEKKSLYVTK